MSDCATSGMRFETHTALALEAAFDGGRITSDGGLVWLAEADSELGLCKAISEHVPEWRKRARAPPPGVAFDGESGHLIAALLRAGNTHASNSAVALLKRIVARLRGRWPEVEIEIRADAGFAVPALYEYCERRA